MRPMSCRNEECQSGLSIQAIVKQLENSGILTANFVALYTGKLCSGE